MADEAEVSPDQALERETDARLAAIIESSNDAIVSKSLDGTIRSWNKGAERIFGYTPEEAIGRPILMMIPDDRKEEESQILARLARGERIEHFETIRLAKDGARLNVSVTISPIRDKNGKVVGASKVARDITRQKQIEQELRAAKLAAEAANNAKDQFLSVLSHELRTPLTPVLGAISYIESKAELSRQELHSQMGMIRRNIETQARLIDDLLDLTRISRDKIVLHFEIVDTHAALQNVVSMVQPAIDQKHSKVKLFLEAKEHFVWADPGRLQQVFLTVLSNAAKFGSESGDITISSSNESGRLKITIADTGVGIEPEVLPRLFQAFEQGELTVNRRFGGLGLGLTIAKSLLALHDGTISIASAGIDKGATVTLTVPTITPSSTAATDSARAKQTASKNTRVLLVEDHADTRHVMSKLLTSLGCYVIAAGTVKEALAISEAQPFDLLISDIGLPDGSGLYLMKQIGGKQKIKGIAISGFGQDEDMRRSHEAGFDVHLVKPVSFKTLQDVLQKLAG